jgi:hypothetical protein
LRGKGRDIFRRAGANTLRPLGMGRFERAQPAAQAQRVKLRDGERSQTALCAPWAADEPIAGSPRGLRHAFRNAGQQAAVAGFDLNQPKHAPASIFAPVLY